MWTAKTEEKLASERAAIDKRNRLAAEILARRGPGNRGLMLGGTWYAPDYKYDARGNTGTGSGNAPDVAPSPGSGTGSMANLRPGNSPIPPGPAPTVRGTPSRIGGSAGIPLPSDRPRAERDVYPRSGRNPLAREPQYGLRHPLSEPQRPILRPNTSVTFDRLSVPLQRRINIAARYLVSSMISTELRTEDAMRAYLNRLMLCSGALLSDDTIRATVVDTTLSYIVKLESIENDQTLPRAKQLEAQNLLNDPRKLIATAFMLAHKYHVDGGDYGSRSWQQFSRLSEQDLERTEIALLNALDHQLHVSQEKLDWVKRHVRAYVGEPGTPSVTPRA